jgi:hypothetical protein
MDDDTAVRMHADADVIMDEDTHVIMNDDPYIRTDDESDTDVPDVIHGDDANDEGSDSHDEDDVREDVDAVREDADDVRDVHAEEVAGADAVMEDRYASATHMTAVHVFSQQFETMPQYVKASIKNRQYSQEMLRNTGTPLASNEDSGSCVQTELGEMLAERLEDDVSNICHDPTLDDVEPIAPVRSGVIQKTIGNLSLGHYVYAANFIRHANAEQQHKVRC